MVSQQLLFHIVNSRIPWLYRAHTASFRLSSLDDCACVPLCAGCSADEIVALQRCHRDRSIAKFFGACNDIWLTLDECLKVDKEVRRKANMDKSGWKEKSEQLRLRTEEKLREREAAAAAAGKGPKL